MSLQEFAAPPPFAAAMRLAPGPDNLPAAARGGRIGPAVRPRRWLASA